MKNLKPWIFLSFFAFITCAFAEVAVSEIPVSDFLMELYKSINGIKGLSVLASAIVIVQLLMMFFKTKLSDFAGKYRLLVVTGLTMVVGILGLMNTGMPFLAAMVHSSTLAAAQVFGHQVIVQFFEKKE